MSRGFSTRHPPRPPLKIAIANDLPLAVESLRRALTGGPSPRHQLAWVAGDGAEAVRRCAEDRPDLLLLDLIMPGMDGVEATRRIMAQSPCAILLVSAHAGTQTGRIFEAMGAGALDVVAPPTGASPTEFLAKIDTMARFLGSSGARKKPSAAPAHPAPAPSARQDGLVTIGSSAGGPPALAQVLGGLPAGFPVPVVIVQHLDEKFAPGLAEWLDSQTPLAVRLARPGDCPLPGTVLLAGTGDHLVFTGPTRLDYTPDPVDYPYRPSVDVFFESAARHRRGDILGVLLTGMGRDGAKGLKTLRDQGHHTVAQDQATSAIYGMPKQAAAIGAAVEILPLGGVAAALVRWAGNRCLPFTGPSPA